ncbi:cellulose-binding domain-containing protein [Heterostelium album PN500]|uniref:Cellulose-binding domain-containing protein n=1 Tax=Heterostelium pallidum (strain ATCC 26659 / Pp 5 / PN500) TaxID=670386 RepID=D3B5J1_HETP5|nr:cellulose-binding domain-containing protein [Heterostelium album PN500]EFA83139.1 cellulose-binding domain-containing protein [Heterostelium album PN500]|eukprot:XP_020435256.1 cellulose-binding domain-containing protein [Heterostelium album PN500]
MNKLFVLSTLLLVTVAIANADYSVGNSPVSISQTLMSSWSDDTGSYTVWQAIITNKSDFTIFDASIIADRGTLELRQPTDLWALRRKYDNVYGFPTYNTDYGVASGGSFKFGYINRSTHPARWTIADVRFKSESQS